MATNTLPPQTPQEEDDQLNPAQNLYQAEFNQPTFSDAEKQRLRDIHKTDQMDGALNDPVKAVRDGEKNATNPMNFSAEGKQRSGGRHVAEKSKNPIVALNLLKRGSPLALIISILLGLGALGFGGWSLLPVHLYQNFMSKFDSNNTSYSIRTNKMIVNKLVGDGTDGDCGFTKILCRYSRPSKYMLDNLNKNGIKAFDAKGNEITAKFYNNLGWPIKRPSSYQLQNGQQPLEKPVTAKEFKNTLATRDEFRAAFHQGLKTRLQTFSDSIFKKVALKYGFTKQDPLAKATSEADVNTKIQDETSGRESTTDANGKTVRSSASEEEVKDGLRTEANKETGKLAKSGMGNAFGLVAGGICLVGDVPGIATRTARAYQMAQVVRFGALFMTTVGALIASSATPTEVAATNNNLTQVVNGSTALDSFGVRYALSGDTDPLTDSNYKHYVPGGEVAATLGGLVTVLDSAAKKDACAAATSPLTGAAIDAAIGPETLGVGTLVNIGVGALISLGISALAPTLIEAVINAIPQQMYQTLLAGAFGDLTKDLAGANYGDALASGVSNQLGQLANAGGNTALTVPQAVAYDQKTQEVNLAYAKEDQATHSPLDASNVNTMMGSLVDKLIPVYSKMGSLTSLISGIGSLAASSTSSLIMGKSYAATADTGTQYKLCDDPTLTSGDGTQVAAGPFCNIQYGIPTQYLDMDPQAIAQDLVDAGQIDPETGEAVPEAPIYTIANTIGSTLGIPEGTEISSYADWLDTCTDGTSDQAVNCRIDPSNPGQAKMLAEYALYTIDHRIQKNMDNEDTDPNTGDAITTVATVPNTCTNTKTVGAGITDIATLNGGSLTAKLNSAGTNAVAFDSQVYDFSDFAAGGFSGFTSKNNGIYGVSTDSTVFEMKPNTSTKASRIPVLNGTYDANNATTNQYYLARLSGPTMKLNCFTIQGTDQGHLYNGVMLDHVSQAQVTNIKLTNAGPGNSNSPPGETFAWNDFHGVNNVYQNIEIDGANKGAAGFGNNSTSGGTWNNVWVHDQKYSAAWTLWQQTNGATIQNSRASNSHNAINLERVTGTVNVTNFTFDNNNHDFNIANEQSNDLHVIVRDPVIMGRDKLIVNIGKISNGKPNLINRTNFQVLVNGVDKTNDLVTFTGGGA